MMWSISRAPSDRQGLHRRNLILLWWPERSSGEHRWAAEARYPFLLSSKLASVFSLICWNGARRRRRTNAARLIEGAGGGRHENVARLVEINICMYLRFLTRHAAVPVSSRPPPRRATPRQSATPRPLLISFRLPNSHPVVFSSHLPVPGPKQAGSRGRKSMEGQVDHTSATSGSGDAFPFLYRLMVESSSPQPSSSPLQWR